MYLAHLGIFKIFRQADWKVLSVFLQIDERKVLVTALLLHCTSLAHNKRYICLSAFIISVTIPEEAFLFIRRELAVKTETASSELSQ